MLDLSQLDLKTSYHKGYDDIARDFYLPCMQRASHFDRAVGYFRSTIFVIAWPALKGFIQRGGKIHILCSQVLADDDVEALQTGYDGRGDRLLGEKLREEIAVLLRDEALKKPARVLAGLVANGILDVQIAVLREGDLSTAKKQIFHDKLGIFRDQNDHRVVFKGSMNETWAGLSADGNLEFVDVAASWLGTRDLERCIGEETYFKALWERRYPGLLVRSFPDVARSELDKVAPVDVQEAIDELFTDAKESPASDSRGRTLKSHQASGLASWSANDRRGILAFATGAGKTFTAIRAIRDALTKFKNVVVVVVPDQTFLFSGKEKSSKLRRIWSLVCCELAPDITNGVRPCDNGQLVVLNEGLYLLLSRRPLLKIFDRSWQAALIYSLLLTKCTGLDQTSIRN